MVTRKDEGSFDLYLVLMKISQSLGRQEFDLNEKDIEDTLWTSEEDREGKRRKLAKVLKRLSEVYGLLSYEKSYDRDYSIRLKTLPQSIEKQDIQIPLNYWNFKWNQKLPLAGKVFYLVSLYESSVSQIKPRWTKSGMELAKMIHVHPWFIHSGGNALRRANLLEVDHDELTKESETPRRPNIYYLKPLYDPWQVDQELKVIEEKVGRDKFKRALKNAALVFAENDVNIIKRLIDLEEKYGIEKIERAVNIMKLKHAGNPKRNPGYFINLIQNLK